MLPLVVFLPRVLLEVRCRHLLHHYAEPCLFHHLLRNGKAKEGVG